MCGSLSHALYYQEGGINSDSEVDEEDEDGDEEDYDDDDDQSFAEIDDLDGDIPFFRLSGAYSDI